MAARKEKQLLILGSNPALQHQVEAEFGKVCTRMFLSWKTTIRPVESTESIEGFDWIICLGTSHRELLESQQVNQAERIEYWPDSAEGIEDEVVDLAARLISGGRKREARIPATPTPPKTLPKERGPQPGTVVRVGRETKGRRGKGVTIVYDVPEDEAGLLALAAKLKQRCGTGGTVKDGTIEIQGDQRDRLTTELQALGYKVKRTGG